MRWLLISVLLMVFTGTEARSSDRTRIETRYGTVDLGENHGTVDIRFRGKVVRSVEALGASLYRVTPRDQREFAIVDALTPGLHCHHFFMLVEVSPDGKPVVSDPFGECKELQGVEFHDDSPLVRLSEPYIPGRDMSSESSGFAWRNGNIVEVSGQTAPKPVSECAAVAETAKVSSKPIDSAGLLYQVVGHGRLQFLSAPSLGCDQTGVFVIAGEILRAYRTFQDHTFVLYVNPKSGKSAQGWVISSRLVRAAP
jgi:hypothetical protein